MRIPAGILLLVTTLAVHASELNNESGKAAVLKPKVARYSYDAMPKDPLASSFFSATLPGTGQLYNREYLRGILTGVAFWGSFFTTQYMVYRWEELNTETFYIEDYYSGEVHEGRALKSESEQVGLPTAEKAVLGAAVAIAAGSYIFGIIDSYRGAKRYNARLNVACTERIDFRVSPTPDSRTLHVSARLSF